MNVTMNVMSFACAPRIVKHRISRTKTLHTPFQPLQIQKIDNFTRTGSRTPSRRLHNTGRREHHFKFSHPHVSQLTANRHAIVCSAAREEIISPSKRLSSAIVSLGATASLVFGGVNSAVAAELEILQTPAPESGKGYIVDDGALLSRAAAGTINAKLAALEKETGFHVNVITIRKLVFEQDPFAFGDKVLETWYPTVEVGNNKGNLLLVKNSKEGAIVGGPAFLKGVGDDILDSILSKNIPYNLEDEKFGEALTSSVDRIVAALEGKEDPGPPNKFIKDKSKTYKTKEETNEKREVFSNVVIGLLVISFVVPMIQYFGYVAGDPDFDDN